MVNLKDLLRQHRAYDLLVRRRGQQQDREFEDLRDDSFERLPDLFSGPGYLQKSRLLLEGAWTPRSEGKRTPRDVRILILDIPNVGGPWFTGELARTFDAVPFSISRHAAAFAQGSGDPAKAAMGIDPEEHTRPFPALPADQVRWFSRLQTDILSVTHSIHEEKPVDLCFAYGTHHHFSRDTLNEIRSLGIPVALWCLDEKHTFRSGQVPLLGSYDLHLTNSFDCLRWYLARDEAAYYFPQAIDPEKYCPREESRDIPVSFIGAAYGRRRTFIRKLQEANIPIECFGWGWENGPVEDIVDIICRSQISLGIGFTGQSERLTCLKERDFQVPATQSCYLTTFDPELTRLFEVGREIHCYREEMDCIEQIRYLLDKPDETGATGRAGLARCLRDHTWSKRMTDLLMWMGILEEA
jgi:hypothetical protein